MVISERKYGSYWRKMRDYKERTFCSLCKKMTDTEIIESKQHIWLECENNRQNLAWTSAEGNMGENNSQTMAKCNTRSNGL